MGLGQWHDFFSQYIWVSLLYFEELIADPGLIADIWKICFAKCRTVLHMEGTEVNRNNHDIQLHDRLQLQTCATLRFISGCCMLLQIKVQHSAPWITFPHQYINHMPNCKLYSHILPHMTVLLKSSLHHLTLMHADTFLISIAKSFIK